MTLLAAGTLLETPTLVAAAVSLPYPILFVTQVPIPDTFTTVTATFGNHRGEVNRAPRGGDLWIRYTDGSLKNLTQSAGFGGSPTNAIAVRQPCVHWSGSKALFSMAVGEPVEQYQQEIYYWQIYEVSGFMPGEDVVVTKVSGQPTNCNNVTPFYDSNDRILFTSDRSRNGEPHLYPQLDEYELEPTVTGIWRLDLGTGRLSLLNHSPSGVFSPSIDSFGRIIFARWDHLQQDQQADADRLIGGYGSYGTFNFSDESTDALILTHDRTEFFPESRVAAGNINRHEFNQFFPWTIRQDGTEEETLNHIGRHEIKGSYSDASFNDDPNLRELRCCFGRFNTNDVDNIFQLKESPTMPGLYYGIDAPQFHTHGSGQIITIEGNPNLPADRIRVSYLTPRSTSSYVDDGGTPPADHTGLYRNPLPLSDGQLVAAHTSETRAENNEGTRENPVSRYSFRLKLLKRENGFWAPDEFLTPGISKSVSYFDPDYRVSYSGFLWELDAVEVRPRTIPSPQPPSQIEPPEKRVFSEEGIDEGTLRAYLSQRDLALVVSRNVTSRDSAERQQPFNLRVPGGTETIGAAGKIYDIAHLQFYQADQIRGWGVLSPDDPPKPGRRVLAVPLHDPLVENPVNVNDPSGSVRIAEDGSAAAFVPARRAMTWQTTAPDGSPVVRERYWLSFQPGEIRTCTSCHGVNTRDQAGHPSATNSPAALRELLRYWKRQNETVPNLVANGGSQFLGISFRRNSAASNLVHTVEFSDDLSQWRPAAIYGPTNYSIQILTAEILRQGNPIETIAVRDLLPIAASRDRFARVRVTAP